MSFHNKLILPLAIAVVLATAACNREAADADMPADTAATDTAATDPASAPADAMPPTDSTATPPTDAGTPPTTPPETDGAAVAAPSTATVAAMDKNADGGLSMDELPEGDMLREHFATADADSNGTLSQAEIDEHNSDMTSQPAQ